MSAYAPLTVLKRESLDYSIADNIERCPRKAQYKYVYNRVSNFDDTESLDFGSACHKYAENLEICINKGLDKTEAHQVALHVTLQSYEDPPITSKKAFLDKTRLKQSCEALYLKRERNEKSGMIVTHTEIAFDLPLPSGRHYGGKIDQIFQWNKRPWIKDYKTRSWMLTDSEQFDLSMQASGYVWAYQQLSGTKIADVVFEIIYNTAKGKPEIKPFITTRNQDDIDNFIQWAEESWDRYEKYFNTNDLLKLNEQHGPWPMHTSTCFDYNKRCGYWNACKAGSWENVKAWLEDNTIEKIWDHTSREAE